MERRNLPAVCVGSAGRLAGGRSWSAAGDRRTTGSRVTPYRGRVAAPGRSVAPLALGCRLPVLAGLSACPRTRCAAPAAGALCLITEKIAGQGTCPTPADQ